MLEKTKWIWVDREPIKDSYGEFYSTFHYTTGTVTLALSVDSNYCLYINGKFVNSGQYPDYPHYKVYDQLDITSYCMQGENHLAIVVWYYGISGTSTYYPGNAGVCFSLYQDDVLCLQSDEKVLSRLSKTYQNGLELYERPVKKLEIAERALTQLVKQESRYYLYDIGKEEVGYLTLRVQSEQPQKLTICFGEHITDGRVRRKIGNRDFSVEVTVGKGITEYTNYFRRLGCRYLEILSEEELFVEYISVLPCFYPVQKVEKQFDDDLWQKIYDTSIRTLTLCMHEHYEDCPWREQALYTMDSRNQMLCGYFGFREYSFPRANLYLMSKAQRTDHLLPLCTPTNASLTIPSFSLHYFTQVYEYTVYSGDKTLAIEIWPRLQTIIDVFLERMKDGLIPIFEEQQYWNFYEWTDDMANEILVINESDLEIALNCLLSIALQNMQKIGNLIGLTVEYQSIANTMNEKIHHTFYRANSGLYINRVGEEKYSELGNALAILCGAAQEQEAERICEEFMYGHCMTKASLSMMCFKYDALLKINKEQYRKYILEDIKKTYKRMLDVGATSFWETEHGESDFGQVGSLCHGWSAMPIYYLNLLY